MRVVFFGTSEFAKNQLFFLLCRNIDVVGVVTQPDKPMGRRRKVLPSPVKRGFLEKKLSIPLLQPEKASAQDTVDALKALCPDLFVVVAYGQILKQSLLDVPTLGCINIHASLLPKYRGAAPIQRAIMAGEKETGITIMKMVKRLDAGDILLQRKIPIKEGEDFISIEKRLSDISGPLLLEVLGQYQNRSVLSFPQDESLATYAEKITPEDRILDCYQPAVVVHNKIRALSPDPGAYIFILCKGEKKRLKITRSQPLNIESKPYETVTYSPKKWVIGCSLGALQVLRVQLEGKKEIDFSDFARGLQKEPHICPSR